MDATQQQQQQQQQQEIVIEPFTNEGGEGWLRNRGRDGVLAYTGETAEGKAEGCGTIRCNAFKWTIRGAAFRGGAMLPCRAVFACDNGDAFAGPLAASSKPADNARGAVVRADGGRFEGTWPARGACNYWFWPLRGAAWVRADGSVHAVAVDGGTSIESCEDGDDDGWPGAAGWVHVGVLKGRAGQVAFEGMDPLWAEAEREAEFAFDDGRRLEGAFRGLCPLRGVLTDADGSRWRVAYGGDAWLTADVQPVTREPFPDA